MAIFILKEKHNSSQTHHMRQGEYGKYKLPSHNSLSRENDTKRTQRQLSNLATKLSFQCISAFFTIFAIRLTPEAVCFGPVS